MRNFLTIILFFFLFVSCDKEKETAKKLNGEWEIQNYKFTNQEGLILFSTCSGSMNFESKKNYTDPNPYTLEFTYDFSSGIDTVQQNGTFDVTQKGDYMTITTINSLNQVTSTYDYRILTRTNTDLQLEFNDNSGCSHMYIFKRKK
jgi:hypothetical protein